jgi:hypothetical protein
MTDTHYKYEETRSAVWMSSGGTIFEYCVESINKELFCSVYIMSVTIVKFCVILNGSLFKRSENNVKSS